MVINSEGGNNRDEIEKNNNKLFEKEKKKDLNDGGGGWKDGGNVRKRSWRGWETQGLHREYTWDHMVNRV